MRGTFSLQIDLSTTMHNLISIHLTHNKPSSLLGVKSILLTHIVVTLIMRPRIAIIILSVILVENFSVIINLCVKLVEVIIKLPNIDSLSGLDSKLEPLRIRILKVNQTVRLVEALCILPLITMNLNTSIKVQRFRLLKPLSPLGGGFTRETNPFSSICAEEHQGSNLVHRQWML